MHNSTHDSQTHCIEWNKPERKKVQTIWLHFYRFLENNLQWQEAEQSLLGKSGYGKVWAGDKRIEENFGGGAYVHYLDSDGFTYILHTYSKIDRIVQSNMCSLLYILFQQST